MRAIAVDAIVFSNDSSLNLALASAELLEPGVSVRLGNIGGTFPNRETYGDAPPTFVSAFPANTASANNIGKVTVMFSFFN